MSEYNCINSSKYGIILDINAPPPKGVLPYKDSTGMCRAKAPHPSPIFRPLPLLSLYFFDLGRSKRPPFQKYTILCIAFPTWADRKDLRLKTNKKKKKNNNNKKKKKKRKEKKNVSLLYLAPKSPVFPVRGRSLSLPFLNPARNIFTNFIFEYPRAPPTSHAPG